MLNLRSFPFRRSVVAAVALVTLATGCRPKAMVVPPAPPPDVVIAPVVVRDEPIRAEWVASIDGLVNAQIRAQVSGYLLKQVYQDGTQVKKGDVLFEIDRRPFEAALVQVQANFDQAELTKNRQAQLSTQNAVSAQERDNAVNSAAAAKGALEMAQLNLEFTRIVSPIDGLAGIATVQIGDLVGPGTGVLTTVSTIDPIKVYFSITEQTYLDFKKPHPGEPKFPEELVFDLVMADGSVYPHQGKFLAADRQIDAGTGTLRLAGVVPNPDFLLRPGQYARVRATIRTQHDAILVPQRSVNELQGGYQVAVVGSDHIAHLRTVKVGDRSGSLWIINSGLQPGDHVVVDGIQKIKEGTLVNPVAPSPAKSN
ncbi:MAG: efflux RND transporter periplasmic adaptor subunit [Opitutaceae bacterium]